VQIFPSFLSSLSKFSAWILQTFPKIPLAVFSDIKGLGGEKGPLVISKFIRPAAPPRPLEFAFPATAQPRHSPARIFFTTPHDSTNFDYREALWGEYAGERKGHAAEVRDAHRVDRDEQAHKARRTKTIRQRSGLSY
jgi:hypothetical protein